MDRGDVGGQLRSRGPLAAWTIGLVVLAIVVYEHTDPPQIRHDSALDTVFDTRWLVAGSRLLVAVTLVYLLLSIGVRIKRRQWVRNAGPLQTDAGPAMAIADSQQDLQERLRDAKATIDDLTARLDRSLEARQDLLANMGEPLQTGHPDISQQEPQQGSQQSKGRR